VHITTWDRDAFQRALAQISERAHLSQAEFAALAGRSRSQFNRWTRAENRPTYDAVAGLAAAITRRYPELADLARELLEAAGYGHLSSGPPSHEDAAEAKAAAPHRPASEVMRTVKEIQDEINKILARMSPEERAQWERDMAEEDARLELIRQRRRLEWARLMRGDPPNED